MKTASQIANFTGGVKTGIPVALGYIPIAIAFGLLTKTMEVPYYVPLLMSLLIYAGASQFIGVNLLALGVSYGEIVVTTFILNLRHFLMTATISQKISSAVPKGWRALLAFGVTDETFTVAALQREEKLSPYFLLGLNTIAFAAWNVGTWIGVFFSSGLPEALQASMGIALYAMFIGLLIPSLKKSQSIALIAILAGLIHIFLRWLPMTAHLTEGWGIVIATIISAGTGAVIYTGEDEG